MNSRKFFKNGGGASPLDSNSKAFGEATGGICLFDDAPASGSAMVSKTYSPCAISEVGEEKSSSRLGILAQQEIPEHLPATPTDAGSHNSFLFALQSAG